MTLFDLITRSQAIRTAILHTLYQARLAQPTAPGVAHRDLDEMAAGPVAFELGYLIECGYVVKDNIQCCITAAGIDQVERGMKASA